MDVNQQDIKKAVGLYDEICDLERRLEKASKTVNQIRELIHQKENGIAELSIPVAFYKVYGILYQKTEHSFTRINPISVNT